MNTKLSLDIPINHYTEECVVAGTYNWLKEFDNMLHRLKSSRTADSENDNAGYYSCNEQYLSTEKQS